MSLTDSPLSFKKIMLASFLAASTTSDPRILQFSSFVPAYLIDTPSSFNYGSFPFINSLDPYVEIKNYAQTTKYSPQSQNSLPPYQPTISKQTSLPATQGFGSSSSASSFTYTPQDTSVCQFPRIDIGGICRCPSDGIFLSGKCFPKESSSEGQTGDNNLRNQCQLPLIQINGRCVCPNDGVYLSGNCIPRTRPSFPTEPIGPVYEQRGKEPLKKIERSYNGKNNNEINNEWGSKNSILQRRTRPNFYNGLDKPIPYLRNPRQISNKYAKVDGIPQRSRNSITMAFVIWGQFLDHDIDLTEAGKTEQMNIQIPYGDTFFENQRYISFFRSKFTQQSPNRPREFRNQITAWIDGSQVYGSDEQTARYLRSFEGGKLRTSGGSQNLLPRKDGSENKWSLFYAGDVRANENVILTSFHTIFMRQHNRICEEMKNRNPYLNDEQIYQLARNYVAGLIQKISMDDFLPLMLGIEFDQYIGNYRGYKPYINPNIPIQFSTAAYRIGHVLIMDTFHLINRYGINYQDYKLRDLFFHPTLISSEKISDIFRGLSVNLMKEKSPGMVNELRNLLVLDPVQREIKLDLFSLNLQRGRDHGLPSYNQAREAYGLRRINTFEELIEDSEKVQILRDLYRNSIDDVELFVGIISEAPVLGGVLGQLGCMIVGQTFRNLRDGDRLWYENSFPEDVISQIKGTSLSDIILRNTNIEYLPSDIFHDYS